MWGQGLWVGEGGCRYVQILVDGHTRKGVRAMVLDGTGSSRGV